MQERKLVAVLQDMKLQGTTDKFLMSYSCQGVRAEATGEWTLCGSEDLRLARLRKATFCLILPAPVTADTVSSAVQTRLRECLVAGTVPVILSAEVRLPFSEVIDWTEAAIILPRQRVTELHFHDLGDLSCGPQTILEKWEGFRHGTVLCTALPGWVLACVASLCGTWARQSIHLYSK